MNTRGSSPSKVCGKPVGPVGYGLMGMTMPPKAVPYPTAAKVMKTALEKGANMWNGGTFYGPPNANSLHLLKYYFEQYPDDADKVILSIKGAFTLQDGPDGSPEGIRASVEEALKVLGGVKRIDIFEIARIDPKVPIETSLATLAELVKEGKIGSIGLSEVGANTIRKAHAIHPIAAVEVELSLFSPDPVTNGIIETCQELGIAVVAYSPMSRGFLTGELKKFEDLPEKDFRRTLPRFQPAVFDQNLKLTEAVRKLAERKGATTAQIAIGWVCRQGAIPIPGSTNEARVSANCRPPALTDEDMTEIQKILDTMPVTGGRYGGGEEKYLDA